MTATAHLWSLPGCRGLVSRQFSVAGDVWTVCEDPATEGPKYGPSLLFYGPGMARRVRKYPGNWSELTAEQLYALSWMR